MKIRNQIIGVVLCLTMAAGVLLLPASAARALASVCDPASSPPVQTPAPTQSVPVSVPAPVFTPDLALGLKDSAGTVLQPGAPITSAVSADYQPSENMKGTLYVNDIAKDVQKAKDMKLTFNPLEYNKALRQWVYPEGSQVLLRVAAKDTNGSFHSTSAGYIGALIEDTFDSAAGIVNASDTSLEGGKMQLARNGEAYEASGSFQSPIQQINGRVDYVLLNVVQNVPARTSISYKLVFGPDNWVPLVPGKKLVLNVPVHSFCIEADLGTSKKSVTPAVDAWKLETSFMSFGTSEAVNDSFADNSRISSVSGCVQDGADSGSMKLYSDPKDGYARYGGFRSVIRKLPGRVCKVLFTTEQETPVGTSLRYHISAMGGAPWTWQEITPAVNPADPNAWTEIASEGKELILAVDFYGDSTNTPVLKGWNVQCIQTVAGEAHDIRLIDEPDGVNVLKSTGRTLLLGWNKSATDGVVYNVYRSDKPFFSIAEGTLVASGVTKDFCAIKKPKNGRTYYYKVTAVKSYKIGGKLRKRESVPSNEAAG